MVHINENQARIDAARKKGEFGKTKHIVKILREGNFPIYKDILWGCLEKGTYQKNTLLEAYSKRFAEEMFMDWEDVDVRNNLRKRFNFMSNYEGFKKEFTKEGADGLPELDEDAVLEYFLKENTFELSKEIEDFLDNFEKFIEKYKINPLILNNLTYKGKVNRFELAKNYGKKP